VSLIKTVYKLGEEPVGILGIIGPKRMEYPKMISLVNFVASTINKIFNKIVGE
ncbi:MAG: heat-inducible transcription repressor HrcA, partial [Elusimicrobia bacterium CG_4_10_14_0_8_um_filter_37_32]